MIHCENYFLFYFYHSSKSINHSGIIMYQSCIRNVHVINKFLTNNSNMQKLYIMSGYLRYCATLEPESTLL